MYLKNINLKGFKSFPDRTELAFAPGVCVIVGPNGCGKSNITDAVLWALGEQSPNAIRGQTMQDVIFSGGKGQTPRRFAEVEVVIDNAEGRANTEFSEISVSRRIDRGGEGEYRLNGARCRLADVVEALSDTNLGREMHSVISQGRVETIVNSKPRERRMLIEEAAGLGKHRKRRRRAQLKLDRTRDNLDRAIDVEREARSRLRPLKRQAEAAERQAVMARQEDELRAVLVAADLKVHGDELGAVERTLAEVRSRRESVEAKLAKVRERRQGIEERIAAGEAARTERSERLSEARTAFERLRARAESVAAAERELRNGLGERQLRLDELSGAGLEVDESAPDRIAQLEAALSKLDVADAAGAADLIRTAEAADARRAEIEAELEPLGEVASAAAEQSSRALALLGQARAEADKAEQRRAALAGELAAVEARLASAAVEGEHEVLASMVEAAPGMERAVSAALGEWLRASVVGTIADGAERLSASGEAAARALVRDAGAADESPDPPTPDAKRLLDLVHVHDQAAAVAARLLGNSWLVEELGELPAGFDGIAVTLYGDRYDGRAGEVRNLPKAGTDPALLARSQREELVGRVAQREQTAERARNELSAAEGKAAEARQAADEAESAVREAKRRLDEAAEEGRRSRWLAENRRDEAGGGEEAVRRARLEAELAVERRHIEQAARAREKRARDREALELRIALEKETLPGLARAHEALTRLAGVVESRAQAIADTPEEGGGGIAEELRDCSRQEFTFGGELREIGELVTAAEVDASQLRIRTEEAQAELGQIAGRLGTELTAAAELPSDDDRTELETKLERLNRRREQIGPVNPLAESEYAEAREHMDSLVEQRKDLESAMSELESLIRRTDREIATAFEETFESTARNFEETVAELFPGGRGRLRRVKAESPAAAGPGGEEVAAEDVPDGAEGTEALDDGPRPEDFGVEIEVTPAGKSMRKLSLLSGGEKSMVALAFIFAVLMARPCPFYILDEVEAALDDINLDRFLKLLRRFSHKSQFVIVTHQKRTMDAADILYGVSMGGDGVTKVISRKLPRDEGDARAESDDIRAARDSRKAAADHDEETAAPTAHAEPSAEAA